MKLNRKQMVLILFLGYVSNVFSINSYEPIRIKDIPHGKGEGELIHPSMDRGYIDCEISTFTIDKKNHLYIVSPNNDKIIIFDLNFNIIGEIKGLVETDPVKWGIYLFVSDFGDIIGINNTFGLKKMDNKGNTLFKYRYAKLPDQVIDMYNIFPYKDLLIYYDDNLAENIFDSTGSIMNVKQKEKVITEIEENNKGTLFREVPGLQNFLKENNLVLLDDQILTTNEDKLKMYFNFIQENIKGRKLKNNTTLDIYLIIDSFIGFDRNNNMYWKGYIRSSDPLIIVFSKYGEVLDIFNFKHIKIPGLYGYPVKVSQDGDLYFWYRSKQYGFSFYKIPRQWGLDQDWGDAPPKALSITATSFIDCGKTPTPRPKPLTGILIPAGWKQPKVPAQENPSPLS